MKIIDDSFIKTGQIHTLNRNLQTASTSQTGSLFASILNQLLLETENAASSQSSFHTYTPISENLFGANTGLGSMLANIGFMIDNSDWDSISAVPTPSEQVSDTSPPSIAASDALNDMPINGRQDLHFRSISPKELNQVLDGKLEGMGQVFIHVGKLYNVDPALLAAISQHETGNGQSHAAYEKNNVAGMMGANGLKSYSSVEASIMDMARNISKNYLQKGFTSIAKIGAKYAPIGADNDPTGLNHDWVTGVTKYYNQLRV